MKRLVLAVSIILAAASCSSDPAPDNSESDEGAPEAAAVNAGLAELDGFESSPVTLDSVVLAPVPEDLIVTTAENDPMVGLIAPAVSGSDFSGNPVEIANDGRAKAIYFVAHWCPHCQSEVTALVDLIGGGEVPDGLDIYVVSTGLRSDSANYPPSAWLIDESWPAAALRDDPASTTAIAFGVGGFPYGVYLDSGHTVVARTQGGQDSATTKALWQVAVGP